MSNTGATGPRGDFSVDCPNCKEPMVEVNLRVWHSHIGDWDNANIKCDAAVCHCADCGIYCESRRGYCDPDAVAICVNEEVEKTEGSLRGGGGSTGRVIFE